MYEWSKDCCPVCGQTSPSTAAPCQTTNYTTYKRRQDILKSKLSHNRICSRKFMNYQKWRKRHQEFCIFAPHLNNLVSTSSKVIHCPSWILVLTLTLLLVCCQGNDVQPAPTMVKSELHDVMIPIGKAFYYKIPVSAFQCEVEQLMVTEASNRFLSHWLAYNSLERELYGVPSDGDVGTYTILVVALARGELKRGAICGSKTFVITVPPEGDAEIPIPLMSAALQSAITGEDGSVQFDNPNIGYRMPCFPGMHTTFASVLVNTNFNQLNGYERINILQRVAVHLGVSPAKLSGFSDQVPHPLISGLKSPSLIATGAGDGRFVNGIRTVFTWTLGCGALKVNKTAISHLTASSQDGTFSESVGHSIFGWHIMSGVQKSLPKIRVRRAALVGTPTPTTTVAMPTAVSVTSTTVVSNGSVSLSRVVPSVNSTISLTPSIISSTLVAPTLLPNLTASSMEFMATLNLSASASEVQTLNATVFIPSTMLNSTIDAVTVIGTGSTAPSFSPSLLLPTQNVTAALSPSPTAIFQTATFSPTPRISSSVAEVKTTSLVVESSLKVGSTISVSAVHSTSLETLNSSSAPEGQDLSPTLSRMLNQTATLVDSLSQTIEPSTVLSTIINQTSLMTTTVSASSSIISSASTSTVNDTMASVSILPSSSVTSASEMISSLITQPNRTESLAPSTNQTSPTLSATSTVSASKTSPVVMTTVLSTTNSTQIIPTSSSVVLQLNKTSDLALSSSQATFTPALNLTSSINVTRSGPVMTTALNTSSSQNITDVIIPTPSSVVLQPNKTDDVVPSRNETTMSPVFSLTPQVTMTTTTFVITPTTQIVTSFPVSSVIPLTATPSVLGTSTRFFITANATKSQVLSASLSNSTHVIVTVSAMTLSPNMSAGDRGSLSISPLLNKTTLAVVTESPVSPVLSLSTEIESSKPIGAVTATDVSLSPTTFGVIVIESSKMTQMKSPSDVSTLSTISVMGSSLLPSESVLFSRTATTELVSSPSATTSSSSFVTSGLNSTTLLSLTSNMSHNVELATASDSLISDSSATIPLVIASSSVLTPSVNMTEDLVTSSIVSRSFMSSTLSDRLESTSAITAQPSITIPSSVDAVGSSLTVMAVNSSSPVLFANESVTFMPIPTPVSSAQLVSHSVVKTSTTGRITHASSTTVALPSPTVTSDVTPPQPSLVPTPLPSTTQIAVVTSKMPTMHTSSLPLTSTLGLSVLKTSVTTGARNVTADSQVVEVTHSTVTLFLSLPSRATSDDTRILISKTSLTTRYLNTTATKTMNDTTIVSTGLPSMSFSPSSIGTSFLMSDTSQLKRSLTVIENSVRVVTVTTLSSLTNAVPSMVPTNSGTISTVSSHSVTSELPVRPSIPSTVDSSTVALNLDGHGSSITSGRTLSLNETKSFFTVFPSMSSPQFSINTSTPTTRTFALSMPLNKTSTQAVVETLTVDITELASPFISSTDRLATKSRNTTAITQVVNERTSALRSLLTVLSSVGASRSELVSVNASVISLMLATTVTPSVSPVSSVETSYSVTEPGSSVLTRIAVTTSSVESSKLQPKSISSTLVLNETRSELSSTIIRQSPLATEEKATSVTAVTLPTQSSTFNVTKSSLLRSLVTKTAIPSYSIGQMSTIPSALLSTSSSDFSLAQTGSFTLPTVTSAFPTVGSTTESLPLSTDSTEQAFSSVIPSPTLPRTTRSPLKSTTVFIRSADITRKSSTLLLSIFPTVINVSAVFTPTTTVIPTSIGPTLEPSTGPTVPPNNRPVRLNDIGRLEVKVGKAFRYAVPHDTFHDHKDGDTRNLSLSCTLLLKGAIPSDYWMQFDSKRQELYGLPLAVDYERYSGREEYERYVLTARDSRGLTARDVFQIVMVFVTDTVTQQLSIRTSNNYTVFTSNVTQRLDLVDRIGTYYSDRDTSAIRFVSVTQGSLVVTWTNDTLPSDRCDEEAVQRISSKVISTEGEVNQAFRNALEPEFPIQSAKEERFGICNITQTYPTIPARGQRSASETDMWLKHVLPGVLVALLVLILALILVIYLRRRRPKPSNPEKITYKKRKPIVLGEEIELKALPAKPLILPDDDISCPPSYLSETSLDKAPHYETDDEDEEDFGKRTPSIRYEPPPPFYHTFDSPRNTPPPSYRLPPSYKF